MGNSNHIVIMNIKVIMQMVKNKEMENKNIKMEIFMLGNLYKICRVGKVNIFGKLKIKYMKVNF